MWTNVAKEIQELPTYTFLEHYGGPSPSYMKRKEMADYIAARAEKKRVRHFIKFRHQVQDVTYDAATRQFRVKIHDLAAGSTTIDTADFLFVCTGHYWFPCLPKIEGLQSFPGKVLHSKDFKDAKEMKGQHVLCVGNHYSGEDIAITCVKYGATGATVCYRTQRSENIWPANIDERPNVQRVEGQTVHFIDGSTLQPDTIILCTGYLHHYPFLPEPLRLEAANDLYPPNLYKGIVWQKNNQLFYIGAQDQAFSLPMIDVQAHYARDIVVGRIKVPSAAEQEKDIQTWLQKKATEIKDANSFMSFQFAYVADLVSSLPDYPSTPAKVWEQGEQLRAWYADKISHCLADMRNHTYTSVHTGLQGKKPPVMWQDDFTDESYDIVQGGVEADN
mmetsp:Transcript_32943/g.95076  ORF Transcript_32943/g.95076 Transcript_32943/m.95076 type:complete len:389 (-) Transcript_32943:624-1790(-)